MSAAKTSRRSLIVNVSLVVLAFGLLGLVVYQNWEEIAKVFHNPVDYKFFALGFGIYMAALTMTFARWHQLVRAQGLSFSIRDAVRLGFIGNVFNLVIPGAVGGDVIKAAYLCRMQPDRKPQAVASMVLDRILGLLGLFLLAGIAGAATWSSADSQVKILIGMVWAGLSAGFAGLAVVFSPSLYRPLNRLVAGRGKFERAVRELEAIGLAYRKRLGTVVAMLGVATFGHALYVLAFYVASTAIFRTLPTLVEHYLMVPLTLFTTAVPVPFGALGFVEGISGKLFGLVHHDNGAIAMMAFRVLMYGSGLVGACIYLANLRQVRSLAAEAVPIVDDAIEETIVDPDMARTKTAS